MFPDVSKYPSPAEIVSLVTEKAFCYHRGGISAPAILNLQTRVRFPVALPAFLKLFISKRIPVLSYVWAARMPALENFLWKSHGRLSAAMSYLLAHTDGEPRIRDRHRGFQFHWSSCSSRIQIFRKRTGLP